jgi:hypothetical protein
MTSGVSVTLSRLTQMLAIWCILLAWRWLARGVECIGSMLFLIPLWAVLSLAASEMALFKRYAFIAQYLKPQGVLARLLKRKTLLLLWQSTKALFFTLVLLVATVLFDMSQWLVLLADVGVMATLVSVFTWLLHGEVKPSCRTPLARYWAHWVNTILLWTTFVVVIFYSAHENYSGMPWEEVVHFSALNVAVACDALAVLVRINAVSEALMWWSAQNFLTSWEQPTQRLVVWLAFAASFGSSFLIAWSYSRALTGVLSRPWKLVILDRLSPVDALRTDSHD